MITLQIVGLEASTSVFVTNENKSKGNKWGTRDKKKVFIKKQEIE